MRDRITWRALTRAVDVPAGAKKSLMELVEETKEHKAYEDLTTEERAALVEELRAHKASKEHGVRVTAKARAADARHTLADVEKKVRGVCYIEGLGLLTSDVIQLTSLQQRSGVRSIMYNVRDTPSYPLKPNAYFSDVPASQFMPDVMKADALEVGMSFEGWSVAKMKGR